MDPNQLQANLFDFAIGELVRRHRESFQPLWTADSWAKLLIWLALNCGCQADEAGFHAFADALGPALCARLRRTFFERELEEFQLRLLADPAEAQVLLLPVAGAARPPETARLLAALERSGLADRVAPPERWQHRDGLVAMAWA